MCVLSNNDLCQRSVHRACYYFQYWRKFLFQILRSYTLLCSASINIGHINVQQARLLIWAQPYPGTIGSTSECSSNLQNFHEINFFLPSKASRYVLLLVTHNYNILRLEFTVGGHKQTCTYAMQFYLCRVP